MAPPRARLRLALFLALLPACNVILGIEDPKRNEGAGSAGAAGQGGGGPGGQGGRSGEAGMAGKGGSGGPGPNPADCTNDETCRSGRGGGSRCVLGACTLPAPDCNLSQRVVIPDVEWRLPIDAGVADGCFFRSLDEAIAAPGVASFIDVYAASVTRAEGAIDLPKGVSLWGHAPLPGQAVRLEIAPAGDQPMVRLGPETTFGGFELDGGGERRGILVVGDFVSVIGPLTVRRSKLALELTGPTLTSLDGAVTTPILFQDNQRAIVVGPESYFSLTGEGPTGVVVEGTTQGAGVLVEAGSAAATVSITELVARNNNAPPGQFGSGAVEIRPNRTVDIDASTFESNRVALTLNYQAGAGFFGGLTLTNNFFSLQQPGTGAAVCVANAGVAEPPGFAVGVDNVFPSGASCPAYASRGCTAGDDVGMSPTPGDTLNVLCSGEGLSGAQGGPRRPPAPLRLKPSCA